MRGALNGLWIALLGVVLIGCSSTVGSPTPAPSAQPQQSPAEMVAGQVKRTMQDKLDNDSDLAKLGLTVVDVTLVHKAGNEYKGLATIRTPKGTERDVPVDVTADGDNILWETPPGAFLFAAQEQLENPPAAAPPLPGGVTTLRPTRGGMVYIVTKSGKTRCQISDYEIGCQAPFTHSPLVGSHRANGVKFSADGTLEWISGDLGDIPVVPIDYRTYRALSWTINASFDGTEFIHNSTGRRVFVSIDNVRVN
ncbi:hypothetical protein JN086_14205 [Mycolicibacterium austroafricanum]|nr:hypothetical protein [Mycolicibacterium austroafricanum]QRZ09255.1 hypothetical protein JN090_12575 [Mycolicibacterium austroafricanum]QZT71028.1 hypothetical protein JN086_14205 [Mycolicibacterium austroafricanum]